MTGIMRQLLMLLIGPLIWFFHFNFIYGAAGFAGAFGVSTLIIRLVSWGATFAACIALIVMLWQRRKEKVPLGQIAWSLTALSLVAVLLEVLVLGIVPS